MRKNKFFFFVFGSLCSWAVVTYFLFLYRPIGGRPIETNKLNHGEEKIAELETELRKQFEENEKFLDNLNKIVESQHSNQNSKELIQQKEVENNIINPNPEDNYEKPEPVIAVIVFACNRVSVKRCLDKLIQYRPSKEQFPIYVSHDCNHQPTIDVIRSYGDNITELKQPDESEIIVPPKEKKFRGYFKIARHYGWALNETFVRNNYDTVIIVEDDLEVAPDFFEYFLGTYNLLHKDRTLFCVSAWNDNGKAEFTDTNAADVLFRTDFFPGLGWMLTKQIWNELSIKWPKSYWDDWIRMPEQRQGRACIRPELPRTMTFGKIGVSNGLFFEKYLKLIKLNEKFVPFTQMNLTYLMKDNYDVAFVRDVYNCPVVTYQQLKSKEITFTGPVRIQYHDKDTFKKTAKQLGLMDDFKSGVPRTGYRGIVSFSYNGRRVYLAPNSDWKGYDPTWS